MVRLLGPLFMMLLVWDRSGHAWSAGAGCAVRAFRAVRALCALATKLESAALRAAAGLAQLGQVHADRLEPARPELRRIHGLMA